MHISPSFLLVILVIFVFTPSIEEWVTQGGSAWYRPYQLWLITIILIWWNVHRSQAKKNHDQAAQLTDKSHSRAPKTNGS